MATDTVSLLPETRSVPLAWRNLVSNKLRLVRSIAGIGFAVLLMLVQLGFERGFFDASLGMLARDSTAICSSCARANTASAARTRSRRPI